MLKNKSFRKESGNAVVAVLATLLVVAVGALGYMAYSGKIGKGESAEAAISASQQANAGQQQANAADTTKDGKKPQVIKPGNPVVAKVGGEDVTRLDVFNFIQTLPAQTRQLPLEQLYPMALEQVINGKIVADKTKGVNLDSDPDVKKQMADARTQITRSVWIQQQVAKKVTDDRLKTAYDDYVKNFPDIQDVKARHILVKDEAKAKDLIKQLDGGAKFEDLAKANSIDGTAQNGGDLGYFAKTDVVPAFGEAAFALNVGEYSKTPVKTDFGYHIIKVEEKRKRPPANFDEIKPYLETQVRQQALGELLDQWRKDSDVQRFDINGDAIEPSAGGDAATGSAAAPVSSGTPAATPADALARLKARKAAAENASKPDAQPGN